MHILKDKHTALAIKPVSSHELVMYFAMEMIRSPPFQCFAKECSMYGQRSSHVALAHTPELLLAECVGDVGKTIFDPVSFESHCV
jgi:hypothetical protein